MTKQNEKDAKRVPELRFKGFADAWEQRKLGEIADFNPKEDLPLTFEYVDLESVSGTTMIAHRTEQKSSAPSRAQRLARLGDLFYQNVRPYQKNNYLLDKNDHTYVFSTGYTQMRPIINGYFLLTLVQRQNFVDKVLKRCTGTSYPAINSKNLSRIKVLIPSTSVNFHSGILDKADMNRSDTNEAEKIGQLFQSLDKTITLHEEKQRQLEQLKKALLQKMFADETGYPVLRFTGFSNTWKQCKLKNLSETFADGNWIESKDQSNSGIRLIQTGNIGINQFIEKKSSAKWISIDTFYRLRCTEVFPGDVLISRLPDPAGRACIVPNSPYRMIAAVDCTIFRSNNQNNAGFIVQELGTDQYFSKVKSFLAGGTRQRISRSNLENIIVRVPTIDEQVKIANIFKYLDTLITLHQHKIDNLKRLKRALLQKMFV